MVNNFSSISFSKDKKIADLSNHMFGTNLEHIGVAIYSNGIWAEVIKNRKGDIDKLSCSINKANKKINWKPKYSNIENIIKDEIKWVKYLKVRKFKRKFKNYT